MCIVYILYIYNTRTLETVNLAGRGSFYSVTGRYILQTLCTNTHTNIIKHYNLYIAAWEGAECLRALPPQKEKGIGEGGSHGEVHEIPFIRNFCGWLG
jgi:hypothetical protein